MAAHAGTVDGAVIDSRHRYPGILAMTIVTGIIRVDVGRVFTRGYAAIVATDAGTRHAAVIKVDVTPVIRAMAIVAGVGAGNVRGVFTHCDSAIVTAYAGTVDGAVIDSRHRYPRVLAVTIITGIRGVNMRRIFTRRYAAIVTTNARSCHTTVIKVNITPVVGAVTIVTSIGTRNVRGGFSHCNRTIVTAHAGTVDGTVIHPRHRYPRILAMTIITGVRGIDMGGILTGGYAAVVATDARSRNTTVIEINVVPITGGMAIITSIGTGDVYGVFSERHGTVVATYT
ncbi:MAG: hypothetical protein AB8B81_11215 [Halioglobus sp.]